MAYSLTYFTKVNAGSIKLSIALENDKNQSYTNRRQKIEKIQKP